MDYINTQTFGFVRQLDNQQFETLQTLASWMRGHHNLIENTHYCDPEYNDLAGRGEALADAIEDAGFTYEQVENFSYL